MAELGELVTGPALDAEFTEKCPFREHSKSGSKPPAESPEDDDQDSAEGLQENDGGVLGQNLEAKKPGDGTSGPFPPGKYCFLQKANDSQRGDKKMIWMDKFKNAAAGNFPFTVAAHHLIPGNASLYNADVGLVDYMDDGKSVKTTAGKTYTIDGYIGYDVNGSHNGVWLPGNYAIKKAKPQRKKKDGTVVAAQAGTTPVKGKSWGGLNDEYSEWQFYYVAGACKAGDGQFHDSHEEPYSASVRKNLTKIAVALSTHLDGPCPHCKSKKKVVPPPYRIKARLYGFSQTLRGYVTGAPQAWKNPWFTSQRWSEVIFDDDGDLTEDFLDAFKEAEIVDP